MTKFIGRLASFGLTREGTRGTLETTADYWIPTVSLSLDDEIEQVIDNSSVGIIEDATEAEIVGKIAVASIEANIGVNSIGAILLAAFGAVSVAGPTDEAYTHTFTVDQSAQHDSFTLFLSESNQDWQHALGVLTNLELNVVLGQYARFVAGFRAKAGTADTLTPSISAETQFLPQHGTIKLASAQSGLDAAAAQEVRSFNLQIEKNVEDDRKIGSVDPDDILNREFMVSGSFEMVYDADTIKDTMLADTAQAIRLSLAHDADVIGGGSTNPSLQIDLYKAKINAFRRNFENSNIVVATVEFKGLYSLSDSKMIDVELVNGVASYTA